MSVPTEDSGVSFEVDPGLQYFHIVTGSVAI